MVKKAKKPAKKAVVKRAVAKKTVVAKVTKNGRSNLSEWPKKPTLQKARREKK
jgi:hypothetical protein